ncbi:MAG: glycosyltransferase family 39 protein [Holophagales bacterium]|nr:glycosyltransferase family 39 protein [Holophagales bacterium]
MDASLTPPRRPRGGRALRLLLEALAVTALAVVSLLAVWSHQRDDSPTSDEAIHLFSGAEALEDGFGWLNPEHPPLLKLAGAFALRPLGLRTPCEITPCTSSPFGGYSQWLYGNRAPAHAIVAAGRRPFPWLLAALVVAMHLCVRPHAGPVAALLATGLVAFDPTFVAHAAYVHTDVGAALAFLLVTALCARAAAGTTLWRWLVLGLALGLALVTKFSTVLLVPVVVAAGLSGFLRRREESEVPGRSRVVTRDRAIGALLALGIAALVVQGVYGAVLRRMSPELAEASIRSYLQGRPARPDEVERYAALARIAPPLGHYVAGARGVALLSERGRGANFFRGEVSERGFPLYFPAVLLLKSTPAFLAILVCALPLGILRIRSGGPLPAASHALAVLVALGLSAVLLVVATRSTFNIGARHVLPVWTLLVFAGTVVFGRGLAGRPGLRAAAAAVLVGSAGASLLSAGPSPIAYFNGLAGGAAGGRAWFSDSNVDWGQDLYRLHVYLQERGWEETTTIVAFGGVATNYYSRTARLLDPEKSIAPGRYAVSHMMETLGTRFTREFEGEAAARQVDELLKALKARGRRIALVGGSITIWELPG